MSASQSLDGLPFDKKKLAVSNLKYLLSKKEEPASARKQKQEPSQPSLPTSQGAECSTVSPVRPHRASPPTPYTDVTGFFKRFIQNDAMWWSFSFCCGWGFWVCRFLLVQIFFCFCFLSWKSIHQCFSFVKIWEFLFNIQNIFSKIFKFYRN